MTIRAVLFDVGGPIDTEVLHEALSDAHIVRSLLAAGISVSEAEFAAASEWAVESFAPFTYQAMIWKLSNGDATRAAEALRLFAEASPQRTRARGGIELRPGIAELVRRLQTRGLRLGLAANQPASAVLDLDRLGLGQYFSHREVSGHHGYHKPDTRLFVRACEDLDVTPAETVMVGDRIDNDIFPAKLLGMTTVLFRTGRHINQQPRGLHEVPDREVRSVEELAAALDSLTT